MRRLRLLLTGLLLMSLVTGCNDEETTPEKSAVLTIALPSPATPGQEVTVYGRLPAEVTGVRLTPNDGMGEGQNLGATRVKDGLRFTLPEAVSASLYDLTVPGIDDQKVTLDVIPRLDAVSLNGSVLTVRGAGWGDQPANALVEVNGQRMVPQGIQGERSTLTVTVNAGGDGAGTASDLYGALNVRVIVGERASETGMIRKEARRARGQVLRPVARAGGTAAPPSMEAQGAARPAPAHALTLLVPGDATLPPAGWRATEQLTALGVRRVTYATLADAEQAHQALLRQGVRAEYDLPLTIQASVKVNVQASAIHASALEQQWWWPLLGLPDVWPQTQGKGVTVAVVDTGVALDHPELKGQLLPGWDFVENDAEPQDLSGHGTHVTGLIAAHGTLTGAAPAASILPVRVIGPDGGTVSALIEGLLWAAGLDPERPNPHPAKVINLSLGTPEYSDLLQRAVYTLLDHGVILVAANGNDGGLPYAPANIPGVIAVTALSGPHQAYQPSYANRGAGTRLAAYGGDLNADQDKDGVRDGILSSDIDAAGKPAYAYRHGTSMAAPQVSGIAALMLAKGVPTQAVKALLEGQATDLGVSGMDLSTGWGLVNARTTLGDPDVYVAALNGQGRVITYVRPTAGTFEIGSLPPQEAVTLIAGTDADHDGVIGEAGELLSAPVNLEVGSAANDMILQLNPADGERAWPLPR